MQPRSHDAAGTGLLVETGPHLSTKSPDLLCLSQPAGHTPIFVGDNSALRLSSPQVELQGVCLVVLSFFRDAAAAKALADTVAAHGGVMGAAVCCAEDGGNPADDWTTCDADRDMLLDRWGGLDLNSPR